jgi:hypothetical protein
MKVPILAYAIAAAFLSACYHKGTDLKISTFSAPDSLGHTLLVSVHDVEPVGSVSFISYKEPASEKASLVTYFSDGSVLSEELRRKGSGELEAVDGAPTFIVKGDSVIRMIDYTTEKSCISLNFTKTSE